MRLWRPSEGHWAGGSICQGWLLVEVKDLTVSSMKSRRVILFPVPWTTCKFLPALDQPVRERLGTKMFARWPHNNVGIIGAISVVLAVDRPLVSYNTCSIICIKIKVSFSWHIASTFYFLVPLIFFINQKLRTWNSTKSWMAERCVSHANISTASRCCKM